MKFASRTLNWLIIAYWSIILLLSVVSLNGSLAITKGKVLGFRKDYLFHILLFIPWMILAKWRWKESNKKNIFWFALSFGIMFAGISEAIQIFVPYRTFNVIDLAANCLGVVIGALISGWGRGAKRQARQKTL